MKNKNSLKNNLNIKGRKISQKYPKILPALRLIKKKYFTKHKISLKTKRMEKYLIDQFSKIYYDQKENDSRVWQKTTWLGTSALKLPTDLWVYQEILYDIKPDVIIETGTMYGGSALFLATICNALNKGKILSIDINKKETFPEHDRIEYITGSSISEKVVNYVKNSMTSKSIVLVILDSDHSKNHVLKEMEIYSKLVSNGSYLIVEDTAINGHPIVTDYGEGPMEAIQEFLKNRDDFEIDKHKEKFLLTWNPNGYLKKIK